MKLVTDLPLATIFFKHWHIDDSEVGIIVAKARFYRAQDGLFYVNGQAPELVFAEVFDGDPALGAPLAQDQDIAPGKMATDLIVHAIARSPRGAALADWPVALRIADRLHYGFHVRGPAFWQKQTIGWRRSAAQPLCEVPIDFRHAYGGRAPGNDANTPELFEFNPAGQGFANRALLQRGDEFPAAQIGELAEFIAQDPLAPMTVHGFGPISKTWLPRRSDAGTFDEHWRQTRAPRMPPDYDLRFWNTAHRPLQLSPPLKGWERIEVGGISHHSATIPVTLPAASLYIEARGDADLDQRMVLDTVEVDLRSDTPAEHSLLLTWRARIQASHLYHKARILSIEPEA